MRSVFSSRPPRMRRHSTKVPRLTPNPSPCEPVWPASSLSLHSVKSALDSRALARIVLASCTEKTRPSSLTEHQPTGPSVAFSFLRIRLESNVVIVLANSVETCSSASTSW